jgi:hypothetical protein
MPRIQPFVDPERHITISSRTRSARACTAHVFPETTNIGAEFDRQIKASSWVNR